MAKVVTGDERVFIMSTYGHNAPSSRLTQYVERSREQSRDRLTDMGRRFYDVVEDSYHRFINSDHIRMAKAALRRVQATFQDDCIRPLTETYHVQNAPDTMLRGIMAEPTIRRLYNKDMCDGFSDRYVDDEPGRIGEDHTDYRRIMNGIVVLGEDEDDFDWKATTYSSSLDEDSDELSLSEQTDYLVTWDTVLASIKGRRDPTSKYDDDLC